MVDLEPAVVEVAHLVVLRRAVVRQDADATTTVAEVMIAGVVMVTDAVGENAGAAMMNVVVIVAMTVGIVAFARSARTHVLRHRKRVMKSNGAPAGVGFSISRLRHLTDVRSVGSMKVLCVVQHAVRLSGATSMVVARASLPSRPLHLIAKRRGKLPAMCFRSSPQRLVRVVQTGWPNSSLRPRLHSTGTALMTRARC